MAKVIVENTRQHDITLSANTDSGLVQVTAQAAKENPLDRNELVNGSAEVEDSFVAEVKKNPVVAHYFDEGWLRVVKSLKAGTKE